MNEREIWLSNDAKGNFVRTVRESLLEELRAENEELKRVLCILRNETRGTLHAHELAIRYNSGNSNWHCLEIALSLADQALTAKAVEQGEEEQ